MHSKDELFLCDNLPVRVKQIVVGIITLDLLQVCKSADLTSKPIILQIRFFLTTAM